ncbi:aldehyde dehydrogenase family protein [soil metagenome]
MFATSVESAVATAKKAFASWSRLSLGERGAFLRAAQAKIAADKDALAQGIALETGKPLREAIGEVGAVIAKFDLTIADAAKYLAVEQPADNPHPAWVRHIARGPAAVVGPFNFPIHLAHGAIVAHLIAGNTVIFKPSPLAANVAARYSKWMGESFPPGVFNLVQGGGEEGRVVCVHPDVRAVCFTGSVSVGKSIAKELACDIGKDVALELGGKNAAIVLADADLALAATAAADGACLTAGQRCNATNWVIAESAVFRTFLDLFTASLARYVPGDPRDPNTLLGPLISAPAMERYARLITESSVEWVVPGRALGSAAGLKGHYVTPAVALVRDAGADLPLLREEAFAPIVVLIEARDADHAAQIANSTRYGLSTSVFTRSNEAFWKIADQLEVGNVYANLPTTFSPSTLPFGGLRDSGNGRPGGRGFVRFTTQEQAIQIAKDTLSQKNI